MLPGDLSVPECMSAVSDSLPELDGVVYCAMFQFFCSEVFGAACHHGQRYACAGGVKRNPMQLAMDGMSVFTFGISKAPKAVNELLAVTGVCAEEIDMFDMCFCRLQSIFLTGYRQPITDLF